MRPIFPNYAVNGDGSYNYSGVFNYSGGQIKLANTIPLCFTDTDGAGIGKIYNDTGNNIRFTSGNSGAFIFRNQSDVTTWVRINSFGVECAVAGMGVRIKGGANGRIGTATLVGGTVTIPCNTVSATTRIMYSIKTIGGAPGLLSTSRVNGVSFSITSTNVSDTSIVEYVLFEET